ncbi:MAG: 7-cyano-7-deazaguanine synthase QueC [Bdellovibrionaceae bacterium]|jgi:7-cyano-7-deazaguanine synthase|nr:7-cyano-7-deazaguanine synthase QueC [Pseudobdellovibrionaceae bacterium]
MSNKKKVVALLSSGLDSTINLFEAVNHFEIALALTFDYGQKAAAKEIENSKRICSFMGVEHKIIDLRWFKDFTETSLINQEMDIPSGDEVKIHDLQRSGVTAESVWVPNRNGIFLNVAAGFAEGLKADHVIVGFNKEEAKTFPDNTEAFTKTLDAAFSYSTANSVTVKCFTLNHDKTEIYKMGMGLNVPFELIWPCYDSQDNICKECESCQRYLNAQKEAQL